MDDVRDVDRLPPLPAPSCPVSCRQADSFFLLLFETSSRAYVGVRFSGFRVYEACVCSRAYLNPKKSYLLKDLYKETTIRDLRKADVIGPR